jgi:hypothetical protein
VPSAEARTGPRPESSGNADSQRAPRVAAAAASSSAPAPGGGGRPVDNSADDRALVPYQAEARPVDNSADDRALVPYQAEAVSAR